ncbi:hypothetical protein DMUE_6300, partial [Dictyocoela muelleri]
MISSDYGVEKKAIRRIMKYLGKLVIENQKKIKIGGENVIVEIDESKFGKRKYNRGHRVEGTWVVGGVERSSERRIFLKCVKTRNEKTLTKLLLRKVCKESILYTDLWRGYNKLKEHYDHKTVNHSKEFVDKITGVHTNTIEGTWYAVKTFVGKRYFNSRFLKYRLGFFMFKRNYGNNF